MVLTTLEKEILQQLANGKRLKEISAENGIPKIYEFLEFMRKIHGCSSTNELVIKAFREKQIA